MSQAGQIFLWAATVATLLGVCVWLYWNDRPRYCRDCGKSLERRSRHDGYDRSTGKRRTVTWLSCPTLEPRLYARQGEVDDTHPCPPPRDRA